MVKLQHLNISCYTLLFFGLTSSLQASLDQPLRLTWGGFVGFESFLDTRQTLGKRDGHELWNPLPKVCCKGGGDATSRGDFFFIPFNDRLRLWVDGPAFFKSQKTFAYLEADFRGVDDAAVSQFRLRKAFIDFTWKSNELLVGQYFHPLFVYDCYPITVAYSTGDPLDCATFNPQVRFTQVLRFDGEKPKDELMICAVEDCRMARSNGPDGFSVQYAKWAMMPAFNITWRHLWGKSNMWGLAVNFRRIQPRLVTNKEYCQDSRVDFGIFSAYGKIVDSCIQFEGKINVVQGGEDLGYISGYAVESYDPETGRETYAPLRSISAWLDIHAFDECTWAPGLFLGVAKNRGADTTLYIDPETDQPITHANEARMSYLVRCSPRVWFKRKPLRMGFEVEVDWAAFGKLNDYGQVLDAVPVHNIRFLMTMYYDF